MIIILIILFICSACYLFLTVSRIKLNKRFYKVDEVYPYLTDIYELNKKIESEVSNVLVSKSDKWVDWPEKYLYDEKNSSWKIYPFYAFGIWVNSNCESCPTITKFLKSIKGLKLASLSKLSPNLKLDAHQGYGSHSNNILRCHYPIIVPKKKNSCKIHLADSYQSKYESVSYKKFKWIIFDDAKVHWVENQGESDRIVLLLDIERPEFVEKGQSIEGDSTELLQLIEYFKSNNIEKN